MSKVTLGGERLGTGKKMKVDLHGYERSSHNQSYVWTSSMSPGTIVPFLKVPGLPGTNFDIDLQCEILTQPTIGPLFGSYKVQLDVFSTPMRLYNRYLHNNMPRVGLDMSQIKVPQLKLFAQPIADLTLVEDIDNCQINPSCILKYLGISGIGLHEELTEQERDFNAIPYLAYWDIYYNYYANLQEEIGAVVHCTAQTPTATISGFYLRDSIENEYLLSPAPTTTAPYLLMDGWKFNVEYAGADPDPDQIYVLMENNGLLSLNQLTGYNVTFSTFSMKGVYRADIWGNDTPVNWSYITNTQPVQVGVNVETFPIENIADMRQAILSGGTTAAPFYVNTPDIAPYKWIYERPNGMPNTLKSQEGLGIKTYLSDKFNNWLKTAFIQEINDLTAISTTGDSFTMDAFYLGKKLYELMNRVAVSGGSYNDWISAVYDEQALRRAETPMYMGGLVKELVFQEVVSNADSGSQPLGTLAGRGKLSGSSKGGTVKIKCDEPCYIMGNISITPRLKYSQGNEWDTELQTWDQWHKPGLDGIGWEDLTTSKMAWWDSYYDGADWAYNSAGLQPAWIDYMTAVDKTYGNFAIENNAMFMTLNRRYEIDPAATLGTGFVDLTTYVDPGKFNFIFAQAEIDAQNFWAQVGVNMTSRRKMSAKQIPNL